MDKIITTVLLIMAGIICTIVVFDSVYPMINRSSDAMSSMTENINDRMKTRINIIHAGNDEARETVYIYVKNVGDMRIVGVEDSDLFFGEEGDYARIANADYEPTTYPQWDYEIENGDSQWVIGSTILITIDTNGSAFDPGTYYMKFILSNGISDEFYFSMA